MSHTPLHNKREAGGLSELQAKDPPRCLCAIYSGLSGLVSKFSLTISRIFCYHAGVSSHKPLVSRFVVFLWAYNTLGC
jgi:hypothetical protein